MKQHKLPLFLFIFLVVVLAQIPMNAQAQSTWVQEERGRDYVIYFNSTNPAMHRAEFGVPTWVWNGASYVPHIFNPSAIARDSSDPCFLVRSGLITVEIMKNYPVAKFWDVNYTEVRLYEERINVESYQQNQWKDTGVGAQSPSYTYIENSTGVFITRTQSLVGVGKLVVTYVLRDGCPLKHNIVYTSLDSKTYEFRIAISWFGIVGNKVQCQTGTNIVTTATTLSSTWYQFQKADGTLSVFEDLFSAVQFNQPATIGTSAQGMEATFTFQNATRWTVGQNGVIQLDPDTYTFQSTNTVDNYLHQALSGTNYGTEYWMLAGYGLGTDIEFRSILKFDVSGTIPSGSTINSATLYLYYWYYDFANPVGRTFWVYCLTTTDWTETGSCWNYRYGTTAWTTAGGDYTGWTEVYAASAIVPASYGWMSWTVTAQVQYAINDVGGVAHFLVKDGTPTSSYDPNFYTKEYTGDTAKRPKLTVDYTAPPTITITLATSPAGFNVRLDGGTWYAAPHAFTGITPGSSHSVKVEDPSVVTVNQEQYVWYVWSDSGANPHNVAPTTSTTYTASMAHQWYFLVSSAQDTPTGQGWYNAGSSCGGSTVTRPVSGGSGIRYETTGWTGTGSLSSGGTYGSSSTGSFTINAYSTCTWNWLTQYQPTITLTGATSSLTTSITQRTLNGASNTPSGLYTSWSDWCDSGTTLTFSTQNTGGGSSTERLHTVSTVSWAVTSAFSATITYIHQWKPAITLTGTTSSLTVSITARTLDGSSNTPSGLYTSWSDWCDDSTTLTFSASNTGGGSSTERLYTTGTVSWSVTSAFSATITYIHQWKPTITLGGTSSGDTVNITARTLNGASNTPSGLYTSWSDWCDDSTTLTFSATSTSGKQCRSTTPRSWTVSSAFSSTPVWDRIRIDSLGAVNGRINVGLEGCYYATASLEFDSHPLGSGDSLTLGGHAFTWVASRSRFEYNYTSSTVQAITINSFTSGNEATYGITGGNINGKTATISWVASLNFHIYAYDLATVIPSTTVTMNNGSDYQKTSNGNGWANYTGIYASPVIVKVQWQGSWVNGTFSLAITTDTTLSVQCKIYSLTPSFKDNASAALYVTPSSYALKFPNNTIRSSLSPGTAYKMQNGTTELVSATWQGTNTVPSTHPTFNPESGSPAFNLRIYKLSCQAKDQFALNVNELTYKLTYPNSTSKSYDSNATGYCLIGNQVGNGTLTFNLWWHSILVNSTWNYALTATQDHLSINTLICSAADNVLRFALNETAITSYSFSATYSKLTLTAIVPDTKALKVEVGTFGKPYYVKIDSSVYPYEGDIWTYSAGVVTVSVPFSPYTRTIILGWTPYSPPSEGGGTEGGVAPSPELPPLPKSVAYIATGGGGSWLLGLGILCGLFGFSVISYRYDRRTLAGLLTGISVLWLADLLFAMGVLPLTVLNTTLGNLLPKPLSTYLITPPPLTLPALTYTMAEWIQMGVMAAITLGFVASIALYLWEAE